jgi:hypothetical protein
LKLIWQVAQVMRDLQTDEQANDTVFLAVSYSAHRRIFVSIDGFHFNGLPRAVRFLSPGNSKTVRHGNRWNTRAR